MFSPESRWDAEPAAQWAQLPNDVLTAVFLHLEQSEKGVARLVCRPWAQQLLQDASHVIKHSDLTRAGATFFAGQLPSLESLTLVHTRSLFRVHVLTQLTSLEIRQPSYVPDFQPLTDLPRLRKLRLEGCELGRTPCFNQLTQLKVRLLEFVPVERLPVRSYRSPP